MTIFSNPYIFDEDGCLRFFRDPTPDETMTLLGTARARFYELVGAGILKTYLIGPRSRRVKADSILRLREQGFAQEDGDE